MRKVLITLLLISILSLQLLPFCLSETNVPIKAVEDYKQLKQGKPRKDLQDNSKLSSRKDSEQTAVGAAAEMLMRARGVYGGASDIHRGHSKNNAESLLIKSTSSSLWKVSCGLFSFCLLILTGF